MRSARQMRAYLVPDGHGQGRTSLDDKPPTQAGIRTKIKELADGALCASREAAVNLKQILTYAAIAFVIWWVIQEPSSAAHLVHNIGELLSEAAHGISSFVANI
jgi:ABC-type glucose/galactose transport system permease subunit